ncbi:MAG TPA: hypothetical protein VGX72_14985 [Solirubrobacteraceae bacterium]|jgi:hypothetical protein|nr:hypothetical protein [Solirubrobacteraceae bacterium]
MSARPVLAPDAAIALGIASTAMPFARTPDDQVERWLRVLRLHGEVGIALQAIGVSEVPLSGADDASDRGGGSAGSANGAGGVGGAADSDAVANVTEHAVRIADERRQRALTTTDILLAVMHVYGEDFDRVLQVHGTDRQEVLERLAAA